MRKFIVLFSLSMVLFGGSTATAGNFDEFGFGARATSLGGAFTAYASGPEAAYYNPAALVLSRKFNVLTGFSFADYQLEFDSQNGRLDDQTERLDDLSAYSFGISTAVPFLGDPNRFGLGLAIFLPTRAVATVTARAPSSTPDFAQYEARHDRIQAYLSGAVKITDWFYFGAGVQIFANAEGRADVDTIGGVGASEFTFDLEGDAAPILGLYLYPTDNLSFGFTYRGEISLKLDFDVTAFGLIPAATLEGLVLFSPDQFALGMSYNPTDSLFFLLDVTYFTWSRFEDPFLTNNGNRETLRYDDTIVPRVGVEYFATDDLSVRFGYFYRPSPIPKQDGNRNLVDSDKHVVSVGLGYTFVFEKFFYAYKKPEIDADAAKTTVNLFFQFHYHQDERVTKNVPVDPSDPVGNSFRTGGTITNFGIDIVTQF
ncbi:MAG: outer membrane protein transport protein [Planctomycetota bacterium]|nr:outer membrane protein transport protein [Planctomycetota bacterium]